MSFETDSKCPLTPVQDLTLVVRTANAIVANTPRRVDFVHLPMTKDADRQFCAPLTDLHIGEARVFLGLEWKDGRDAMLRRAKAAREFRIAAVMAAIPSNRCPNCSTISELEQMRSAPADAKKQRDPNNSWRRVRTHRPRCPRPRA